MNDSMYKLFVNVSTLIRFFSYLLPIVFVILLIYIIYKFYKLFNRR